jgi:pre-mRNA-processing factor 19
MLCFDKTRPPAHNATSRALSNVQATMESTAPAEDAAMTEDDQAGERLPKAIVAQIEETCEALSSARKKRKLPKGHAAPADVKTYVPIHTIPSLHSASPAGITSLAVSRIVPSQLLTGGNDKMVQVYDKSTDKVLVSLKGHTKRVTHVAFREREGEPTLLLSAGADKIAKIWSHDAVTGDHELKATIKVHKGELTGLAVHPISTIVAYASLDKTFSLHDLTTSAAIFRSQPSDDPYACLSIHPDGALLGLGTPASTVQIYDVRTGLIAASLAPTESSPFAVNSMSFSENGYYLLAPHSSSSIATWDLRKQQPVNVLSLGDSFKMKKVLYDTGGFFFGVAGKEGLRVFAYKTYEELRKFDDAGELSDLAFGPLGKEIWAAGGRQVRIWGPPA